MSCSYSPPPPGGPRCLTITCALTEHAPGGFVRFICLDCHIFHNLHISHAHSLPLPTLTLTLTTCNHLYVHPRTHLAAPSPHNPTNTTHTAHTHTSHTSRLLRPTCSPLQTGPPGKTPHMGRERHLTPTPDQFRLKVPCFSVSRAVTYAMMDSAAAQPRIPDQNAAPKPSPSVLKRIV